MSSVTHFAETLQRLVGEEADRLARENGFLERERVLSGADFVQALILGWLQEPEITLEGLTQVLGRREVSISASGLSQRFTQEAATFLQRVLERLSTEQVLVILRLRWQIERLWRLWKEHGHIDQWREPRSPGASCVNCMPSWRRW